MKWLFRTWLPVAIAVTGVSGLVYVTMQQSYRASLNDPQIRMAHDTADRLDAGEKITAVVPKQHVDIDKSLATWIAVYDKDGAPLSSAGRLFNATPTPPVGALTVVLTDPTYEGENRITWQPYNGVRQALVVVAAGDRIVVSGRDTREVDERVWDLGTIVFFFWIFTLLAALLAARFADRGKEDFFIQRG